MNVSVTVFSSRRRYRSECVRPSSLAGFLFYFFVRAPLVPLRQYLDIALLLSPSCNLYFIETGSRCEILVFIFYFQASVLITATLAVFQS